jgi:hypothetical protein
VCRLKNTRVSHHRYAEAFRPSLRDSFTAYFVLFLVTGLCCHHHPCDAARIITSLNASVGASEPHDFAVRSDVVRLTTSKRPPHPKPNVRGDRAYAPHPGRDGAGDASDLGSGSREKLRTRRSCERTDCWITSHAVNNWDETHGSLTPKEATRTGSVAMRAKADLLCSP